MSCSRQHNPIPNLEELRTSRNCLLRDLVDLGDLWWSEANLEKNLRGIRSEHHLVDSACTSVLG